MRVSEREGMGRASKAGSKQQPVEQKCWEFEGEGEKRRPAANERTKQAKRGKRERRARVQRRKTHRDNICEKKQHTRRWGSD